MHTSRPPAAVRSRAPRIRARFLVALGLTGVVVIVWATALLSAGLSAVPTDRIDQRVAESVSIAAPRSPATFR